MNPAILQGDREIIIQTLLEYDKDMKCWLTLLGAKLFLLRNSLLLLVLFLQTPSAHLGGDRAPDSLQQTNEPP